MSISRVSRLAICLQGLKLFHSAGQVDSIAGLIRQVRRYPGD
jgi:hypothetical protein